MRALHASRDAIAQKSEKICLACTTEWRDGAQAIERVAPGARRMIVLAPDALETTQGKVDRGRKIVHRNLRNHSGKLAQASSLQILSEQAGSLRYLPRMSGRVDDYDFPLPANLIAQRPLPRREDARMMVLDRAQGTIAHRRFADLPEFVRRGDLLVLNDTRVLPARRFSDDGAIEFLFLENVAARSWLCLVKPGRKMRLGETVMLDGATGRVEKILTDGERVVRFDRAVDPYRAGEIPLPPYLRRAADAEDAARYQTVFAKQPGSVAAPTAGLHFTPEILAQLPHTFVTLHVGTGTFRPVQSKTIAGHRMHAERFTISAEAAAAVNAAERILAVGTTSVRVLEAAVRQGNRVDAQESATDIFIHPPYRFHAIDRLLTNFHLPRSTLLMLVAAFAGREFILRAYEEAVRERYRFYSYGDCMLII
jgi:S-adenosylmethionine:tRNA ribosyltransferase-isomerase